MTTITASLVPEQMRLTIPAKHFRQHFPFKIEPAVYHLARVLCQKYQGALWAFYTLSNKGFYMVPDIEEPVHIICKNAYEGRVSKDAFGIICCLYAYSHLSFSDNSELSKLCSGHYHALREFALEHAEAMEISRAID